MQHLRHQRVARTLVFATALGCAALAGAITTASGTPARSSRAAPLVTSAPSGAFGCPDHNCMLRLGSNSSASNFNVQAVEVAPANTPASTPATPADKGSLTWAQNSTNPLMCSGYNAHDSNSFQFYLGQSTLGNVFYKITYTVPDTGQNQAQFCLGWLFPFKTMAGNARRQDLPTGKTGYVGLLPRCTADQVGQLVPCLVSRTKSGLDTVLTAQVPAIDGDPWGRS